MNEIITNNEITNEEKKEQSLFKQIIVIESKKKKVLTYILKLLLNILIIAVSVVLLYFSMKNFDNASKEEIFNAKKYVFSTITIWICGYLILKGITGKSRLSLAIVIGIEGIYDIINYVVRTVRGSAITISDLKAIQTAMSVSKNIKLQFDIKFLYGLLFLIPIILIIVLFKKGFFEKKEKWWLRITKFLVGVLILFSLTRTDIYNTYTIWDVNETYRVLGTPLTLFRMAHNLKVKKPEGYDKKKISEMLEEYNIQKGLVENDKPNVIVIINESFANYCDVYDDAFSNPIPYFTELMKSENVVSGTVYSSSFGGQTANIEYEFLTQNSTRILPVGSYPFQQYITKDVKSSLVKHMKELGYTTSAIHPWENFAYSRNKIYKLFGFDSIKFKNDIEGLEQNFNNEFFTDRSTYRELLKELKEKKEDERVFKYVLTVQNHLGYWHTDPNQIDYSDNGTKNIYMQLIHESVDALKEVIDELNKSDEKYVLLFFGDHQPNLDDYDNFKDDSTKKYKVPFLIWANYDIEEKYDVKTSMVYLQNYLLDAINLPKSAMNNYMEELQEDYPVITKNFYMDVDNNLFEESDDTSERIKKLQEYYMVNYYNLFDNK